MDEVGKKMQYMYSRIERGLNNRKQGQLIHVYADG